jgi:uncharacterized protein DUF4253
MVTGDLPADGELRLGPVSLPAGMRIEDIEDPESPVIWVTVNTVPDAGRTWLALSDAQPQTGLVPVLLRPHEEFQGFFEEAPSTAELDRADAADLLRRLWDAKLPGDDAYTDGPRLVQQRAPFARDFPGLAAREDTALSADRVDAALGSLPPARIGLITASRPADAIAVTGWNPFDPRLRSLPNALWIAAVLRSWEDRFGARLLSVGHGAQLQLLVTRAPRSFEAAQRVAAEHSVFGDGCAGRGLRDISAISAAIVNAPIWNFSWS